MVTVIENAQLVLETGILWDGVLVAKDGVITAFGKAGAVEIPEGAQHIDAKGAYVGPGAEEHPMTVKAGDKVVVGKYAGQELKLDGQEYSIVKVGDILAVVE